MTLRLDAPVAGQPATTVLATAALRVRAHNAQSGCQSTHFMFALKILNVSRQSVPSSVGTLEVFSLLTAGTQTSVGCGSMRVTKGINALLFRMAHGEQGPLKHGPRETSFNFQDMQHARD
eukprot:6276093-Amphidinium_carterae.2